MNSFYKELAEIHRSAHAKKPDEALLRGFIDNSLGLIFPQLQQTSLTTEEKVLAQVESVRSALESMVELVQAGVQRPEEISSAYLSQLPSFLQALTLDAEAIFAEDPAARSIDEVVICYPGFYAIAVYRFANFLHSHQLPIVPRLLTEYAHERTGIDIHPCATIGRSFCIDHGTGVVIGESSVIGDHVKIYQGVTLGGLSIKKSLSDTKRHPTIGDRVVIYSSATILGGETIIGHDSIVGGNVWLTKSIPPFSKVYHREEVVIKAGE